MSENNHHTILLVDDEPGVLNALRRDLRDIDAELITTTDVHEALQLLRQQSISLIISDEKMPGLSGWQFLSLARQIVPETIRVILTAHTDIEAVGMAIHRARVAKLFIKPWDSQALADSVRQLLAQYDREAKSDDATVYAGHPPEDGSRRGLVDGTCVNEDVDKAR